MVSHKTTGYAVMYNTKRAIIEQKQKHEVLQWTNSVFGFATASPSL